MSPASGQSPSVDATLISGDSLMGEIAGVSRIGPGKSIGRYIVLSRLGVGGGSMAVVYAAYDPKFDRKVAIKLLRPRVGGQQDSEATEELLREAKTVAALSHPNIITVHDVGTVHEVVFVVMEHLDGGTLRAWIDAGPRPWPIIVQRFLPVGAGLAAAHHAGVLHRHFDATNVLLACDGSPRVTDFGLTRQMKDEAMPSAKVRITRWFDETTSADSASTSLTRADRRRGRASSLAPEQRAGSESVDARADQFGFCVALYEALYGQRPFEGRTLEAVFLAVEDGRIREPPPRTKVPGWLRRVVVRGLAHDPAQRWPSMDALLDALDHDRKRRWPKLAASLVVGVAALASIAALAHNNSAAQAPAPTQANDARADQLAQAVSEALAAGDDRLAVERITELAEALVAHDPHESLRWLDVADGLIPRLPHSQALAAKVQRSRARASQTKDARP